MPKLKDVIFGAQDGETRAPGGPGAEELALKAGAEPSGTNGDGDGPATAEAPEARHQAWCQATVPAGADRCPRCGVWQLGNQGPRQSGIYARNQPADLRMTADELVDGIVSDLGGPTELSTLEKSYARKLGDTEILLRLLAADIARRGLFTPGGRVRDSYDKFLAGVQVFDRLGQRLGLKRRQKQVTDLARALSGLDGPR